MPRLARLDVRVSAWTAGWRDHFLLMTRHRVWDFRVNAPISDRRGSNYALMLGWGRSTVLLIASRRVFARGTVFSTILWVSPVEAAKAVPCTRQKPRKISAARVVQTTVHARPILVQSYLQYRFCWRFLLRWIERG